MVFSWLLAASAFLSARADDPCQPMRAMLAVSLLCEHEPALTGDQWRARVEKGAFGARIELLVARASSEFRPVPLSTPVCNGDRLAFRVSLSRPGFVHVLNGGTSGRWQTVYPRHGAPPVVTSARVPPSPGEGFPVFGPPGKEHVMIFFSPGAFSEALVEQLVRVKTGERDPASGTGGLRATYLRDIGPASSAAHVAGEGEQVVAFTLTHAERCAALGGDR